jgi:flavorubredoxin
MIDFPQARIECLYRKRRTHSHSPGTDHSVYNRASCADIILMRGAHIIMKAIEIKKGIYWVGGIDWDLRNFHGYITQRGSTYNAYLIIDEKITLVDTVKYYLVDEMMERIRTVIDPSKIDYIVSNHVEMDHSGGLPALAKLIPHATIFTSVQGEKGLSMHYGNLNYRAVQSGETLSLGKRSLTFVHTPMVHWPDNMVSYCPEEKILFSNDAFGQHIASSERFDDEYPLETILEEARKYYANIVLPFGVQVERALAGVKDLQIEIIAPSHGIIWRAHIDRILPLYRKWAANESENRALILYDTMWTSTAKIAHAVMNAFENKGIPVDLYDLKITHISDIMTRVLDAKYICVGSSTLNNNMLPTVAAFLTYFKGLAPKNKRGLAFGSFGWGGQSVGQVEEILSALKFDIMEQIKVQYIPDKAKLDEITKKVEAQL